jgi:hypothetical protein
MDVKELVKRIEGIASLGDLTITKKSIYGNATGKLKDARIYIEEEDGILDIMAAELKYDLTDICSMMINEITDWKQSGPGKIRIKTKYETFTISAA